MAFTTADATSLKAAIATGALEVQYSDGSRVRYRSLPEMKETLAMIQAEANPSARAVRAFRGGFMKSGY